MAGLSHRPFDGSSRPFTIGMTPLDLADWIEPDQHLARDLAEKQTHFAEATDIVFAERPGSEAAQAETLALLIQHLPRRFPDLYRPAEHGLAIIPAGRTVAAHPPESPLMTAARLVQEDLCILQRDAAGWRLTAAALCFPSTWSLAEKIGHPMSAIHADVPDFEGQMAMRVSRIFDNLRPEMPVQRLNWSIYGDDRLHHPETKTEPEQRFPAGCDLAATAHIRVERQTLRRLPQSDAILFTIRIHICPLTAFLSEPDGPALAAGLRNQLLALTPDQLAYKGLTLHRKALAQTLAGMAEA